MCSNAYVTMKAEVDNRKHCELASLNILVVHHVRYAFSAGVHWKTCKGNYVSIKSLSHKKKSVSAGRREVISHSEIEFEPSGSGAHCCDKTSHTIRHTRLDPEQLDPGLLWRKYLHPFAPRNLFLLLHFQALRKRRRTNAPSLELLPLPARQVIDTCLLVPST